MIAQAKPEIGLGYTFGAWRVVGGPLEIPDRTGKQKVHWLCQCSCGTQRTIRANDIRRNRSKKCLDCHAREIRTTDYLVRPEPTPAVNYAALYGPRWQGWYPGLPTPEEIDARAAEERQRAMREGTYHSAFRQPGGFKRYGVRRGA